MKWISPGWGRTSGTEVGVSDFRPATWANVSNRIEWVQNISLTHGKLIYWYLYNLLKPDIFIYHQTNATSNAEYMKCAHTTKSPNAL